MRASNKILVACVLVSVCATCKTKTKPAVSRVDALISSGSYDKALAALDAEIAQGKASPGARDLRVVLLAREGRTPEAMNAYAARLESGGAQDALLLEAIMLSSYPPEVRMDPARYRNPDTRPAYGVSTHEAIKLLLGPELKGKVPRTRLSDLVGLLVVPGGNEFLEVLEECIDQRSEPAVRTAALTGLAKVGTPEAVSLLGDIGERFQVSNIMMRHVLDVLALMPRASPDLAASLLENDNQRVRAKAAGVLSRSEVTKADELLRASPSVEAMAALVARGSAPEGTLEKIGEHVAALEKPLDKARFLDLVRENPTEKLVDVVCRLALEEDPGVATNAANALGKIGHPSAGPCLLEAARSQDENIRLSALKNLVEIPVPEHVAELLAIERSAVKSEDETGASLAAAAIGRAGGEEAEAILADLMESDSTKVRGAAALALFHLGHDEVRATVEEVFEHTEGPWGLHDYYEWRLVALDPDDRTLPLVARAVVEGNPALRDKALGSIMDGRHPESIFLLEKVQLKRYEDMSLEFRHPATGKVYGLSLMVLRRLDEEGDAKGRRRLLERLLGSEDVYLRALGLRHLELGDGPWAVKSASDIMREQEDPWLRLEAVRTLAVIEAERLPAPGGAS